MISRCVWRYRVYESIVGRIMLKKIVCLLSVFCFAGMGYSADTPFDKLLKASKSLVIDSADQSSFDILKSSLDLYKEPTVKYSIVKVLSYSLLNSDESKFTSFKDEIATKYPWLDFAFVEKNSGDYAGALKKSANHLALNASSAFEKQSGNAPESITVNPRKDVADAFGDAGTVANNTEPEGNTEPVTEPEGNTESENKTGEALLARVDDVTEEMKEAGKTKSGDIAKDSIYYKVYHAAMTAQKGEAAGIRVLVKLTFEEKPEELTSAIVKSMTLGMLSANSKSTNPYIIKVNSVFLDNPFLNFLDEEPFTVDCRTCKGKGHRETKCTKCINGSCRNCKGEGDIRYKGLGGAMVIKKCPTCRGEKVCGTCEGDKVNEKKCFTCNSRGSLFNKEVFKPQYKEALQYVIDLTPKLADEAGVYIGVGINSAALARVDELRKAQREKEAAAKARIMAEKEAELARLEEERKKPKVKEIKQGGQTIIVSEFETTEGESNENLDYAVFEFDNFYKVQQKRTGSSIYEKVYGKYEGGRAILYMDVSDEFQSSGKGYKEQILDGCYQFFKLRSGANGSGGNVDIKMMHKGKLTAGTKKGEIFFN